MATLFDLYTNRNNWKVSAKGNAYIELSGATSCTVTLIGAPGRWKWCVAWSTREQPRFSRRTFADKRAAAMDAWETEIAPRQGAAG
jgi:hypothetical protein